MLTESIFIYVGFVFIVLSMFQ